jgi:hypothetical protein
MINDHDHLILIFDNKEIEMRHKFHYITKEMLKKKAGGKRQI